MLEHVAMVWIELLAYEEHVTEVAVTLSAQGANFHVKSAPVIVSYGSMADWVLWTGDLLSLLL